MKNIFLAILLGLTLNACEQGRQQAADLLKAPTAADINLRVLDQHRQGKPIEALKIGEDFLKTGSDPDGSLHATLAKIYTEVGDTDSAIRHLQQSAPLTGSASTTVTVTREVVTTAPPPAVSAAPATGTNGVSAQIGPNGIEARAGGVSARITN